MARTLSSRRRWRGSSLNVAPRNATLFGTVLGVINAFENLRKKTAEAEDMTLNLIAEALAATAFGLLVAIPAVIAFNYFTRKMKVLLGSADEAAHTVMAMVHGAKATAQAAKAEPKPEAPSGGN
jgi:hypothetical protein